MPSDPVILAIDTSAAHCAAALLRGDSLLAERHETMARGQAERLFPFIEEMMQASRVAWGDLGLLAVGVGPGNFTGIRITVSAARGLALGLGIPAMGISLFDVMRSANARDSAGPHLVSLPVARRPSHVFLQLFVNGQAAGKPTETEVENPAPPSLPPRDVDVIGYRARDIASAANAARAERDAVQSVGRLTGFDAALPPLAPTLAGIAAQRWRGGETAPARPAPLYVRPADAAPARDAAPAIIP